MVGCGGFAAETGAGFIGCAETASFIVELNPTGCKEDEACWTEELGKIRGAIMVERAIFCCGLLIFASVDIGRFSVGFVGDVFTGAVA